MIGRFFTSLSCVDKCKCKITKRKFGKKGSQLPGWRLMWPIIWMQLYGILPYIFWTLLHIFYLLISTDAFIRVSFGVIYLIYQKKKKRVQKVSATMGFGMGQ